MTLVLYVRNPETWEVSVPADGGIRNFEVMDEAQQAAEDHVARSNKHHHASIFQDGRRIADFGRLRDHPGRHHKTA